jgi:Ca2+-dependent lipid-binding protein
MVLIDQLKPFMTVMPCVQCVAVGFTKKPDISFQLTTAKIPLSKVPGLSNVLDKIILDCVTPCFVYPNVSVIPIVDGVAQHVIDGLYDELKTRIGELSVEVVQASNLVQASGLSVMGKQVLKFGMPDPCVKVSVNSQVHQTHTVSNSKNPVWNAAFRFDVIDPSLEEVLVEVLHHNSLTGYKPMGKVAIALDTICDGEMHFINTALNDVSQGDISLVVQFRRL